MNPRFVTLDGIDGAGKSTNLAVMKQWFEARQFPILFTRELGGAPTDGTLCEILLNPETKAGLRTETLLMSAARQQHPEDMILPTLKNGIHAVSGRFTDATFVYQGGDRDIPLQDIGTLENWVQGSFRPDLTLLLDVPLEVSLEHIGRVREKDRFRHEQAGSFTRVRNAYFSRAAANPERYAVISGNRSPEAVRISIEATLEAHFGFIGQAI